MESSLKNILVPTDFSEPANNAIKTAIALCKQHNAVLHLLHVVENTYNVSSSDPGIAFAISMNTIEQQARDKLYNIYESIMNDHQVRVHIHMPTGIPFDEICKTAAEMPIDLIVLGNHGTSGVKEFFIGSTAYNLIKNTSKPVLLIPENVEALEFKKILFPIRPVQGIKAKYQFIQSFLKDPESSIHFAVLSPEGKEDGLIDNNDEINEIIESIENSGITCTKKSYACKNSASKVLELSEVLDVDMIAINASLDFKWTQFFMGAYTQQVVNHTSVPVLSFRNSINLADEIIQKQEQVHKFN